MTPLRLIILAILFYIGWRLLRGVIERSDSPIAGGHNKNHDNNEVRDTLIEDPVCHTMIPKNRRFVYVSRDAPIISAVKTVAIHFLNNIEEKNEILS